MPIIEQCAHGKRTIGECHECKKIYYQRTKRDTARWLWRAAKSRARIKGLAFTITLNDVKVPTHCPALGIVLDHSDREHTPSIDAVVPELGYTPRNICVISGRANRIKSDATEQEIKAIGYYMRLRGRYARKGIPESW